VAVAGPVTIDDEIIALSNALISSGVVEKLDELEAAVAELGWLAAVAAMRAEMATLRDEAAEIIERAQAGVR
jgi:hypothetical protein